MPDIQAEVDRLNELAEAERLKKQGEAEERQQAVEAERRAERSKSNLAKMANRGELVPTIVVDDVHIIYQVFGAEKSGSPMAKRKSASPSAALAKAARGLARRGEQEPEAKLMRQVHAVKGVSFACYRGEAVGLVGSNGSGKSTLLRSIAGLLPPASGAVYTQGQPSLLGVNAALINDLTGAKNVVLGCLAMGMSPEQVAERYQSIVDFSGINARGDFISLPMRTYSSGMMARLRFSIAAAKDHDVLLIDEALATGDRKFQKQSERRIAELREKAGTIVLVSHNAKSIRDVCERTIWLEDGKILMDGETEEVLGAYEERMNS
jgi:teichoic acid transport system ATP-binding protein